MQLGNRNGNAWSFSKILNWSRVASVSGLFGKVPLFLTNKHSEICTTHTDRCSVLPVANFNMGTAAVGLSASFWNSGSQTDNIHALEDIIMDEYQKK